MGRKCPWKDFLNIILAWNIQKWPLQMGSGEVASAFVFKSMCPFTSQKCLLQELPLFFSRSALMFPGIVFLFSISALLFSRSVFVFLKTCFILFQNRSLVFQKSVLYIYCECLFPRMVFFQLIVPSPCPAQSCSDRWYLPCCCFVSTWKSLLTNLWCLLDNLNSSTWSMIFCVFHLNFSFHDSLENTIS